MIAALLRERDTLILHILCSAMLLLCCPGIVRAAQPLTITDATESFYLGGPSLDILEDRTAALTINEVSSPEYAGRFQPNHTKIVNFGMTQSAFWLRFTIASAVSSNRSWLLFLDQPLVDQADLYHVKPGGRYTVHSAGAAELMSSRDLPSRNILFPLELDPHPQTLYLRVWIPGRAQFPLTVMTQEAYQSHEFSRQKLLSFYSGFMLSFLLLALFLFLLLKNRTYLYFLLYLITHLLSQLALHGYLHSWLFAEEPWLHKQSVLLFWNLAIIAGIAFARHFLQTGSYAPLLDRLLRYSLAASLVLLPLAPFTPPLLFKQLLNSIMMVASLLIIIASALCYRRGFSAALYFLLSRVAIYLGVLAFTLTNLGFLPVTMITQNLFLLSSAINVIFIALALGEQYKVLNHRINGLINDLKSEVIERTAANQTLEAEMAERRKLEREIVKITDEERRSISHELHDGLCQELTAARLRFDSLADRFAETGLTAEIQPLGRLLEESVKHAYSLSRGLWVTDSKGNGVPLDLWEQARQLSQQSGIQIDVIQKQGCVVCSSGNLSQVQQIAREALMNAVKHAQATSVTLRIACTPENGILLEVNDNGQGFVQHQGRGGNMGIRIMKHRAGMIGGTLEIEDLKGKGVYISCVAPCSGS